MYVIKDLVPDMTNFYEQYKSIKPWLRTKAHAPPALCGTEAIFLLVTKTHQVPPLSLSKTPKCDARALFLKKEDGAQVREGRSARIDGGAHADQSRPQTTRRHVRVHPVRARSHSAGDKDTPSFQTDATALHFSQSSVCRETRD